MIESLGLDPEEVWVYRALVVAGPARREDIRAAEDAGQALDDDGFDRALRSLLAHGLASAEDAGGPVRYRATAPDLALTPLLAARREALRAAEADIARLGQLFQERRRPAGGLVELVHGPDDVRHRFLQVQLSARHRVLGMMPVLRGAVVVPPAENPAESEALRRGVQFCVVLERAWFDLHETRSLVADALAVGQELWVVDETPARLVIADERVAMVSLTEPDGEPRAAVIHEPALVATLAALVNVYRQHGWQLTSVPPAASADVSAPGGPDEIDRSILALLCVGLTDANIANQLGIGQRSVQRRVGRLMGLAQARSRFQLGVHAATAGWLPGRSAA